MNLVVSSRRMSGVAEPKLMPNWTFTRPLNLDVPWPSIVYGHEDAVTNLAVDGLGEMALARRILDEDHLARADDPGFAVAGGNLHAGVEVDDVLAPRRGVPVEVVAGLHLAEDDAGGGQAL